MDKPKRDKQETEKCHPDECICNECKTRQVNDQRLKNKLEYYETKGVICSGPVVTVKSKRGKDIECFADLPPDVQQTIDSLSMVDGKICQRVKANRTAIAINYQHLFPDRFHSTGVAV